MQSGAENLLRSAGVDVDSLTRSADVATQKVTGVAQSATPTVSKVAGFFSASTPETLAKYAAVAVAAYYLSPFLFKSAVAGLRGYAGACTSMATVLRAHVDHRVAGSMIFAQCFCTSMHGLYNP